MRDDEVVRVTLDIDEDVLESAKELAARRHTTAGRILSQLARILRLGANTVSLWESGETSRLPRWTYYCGSSGICPAASTTCAITRHDRRAIEGLLREPAGEMVGIGLRRIVVSALDFRLHSF